MFHYSQDSTDHWSCAHLSIKQRQIEMATLSHIWISPYKTLCDHKYIVIAIRINVPSADMNSVNRWRYNNSNNETLSKREQSINFTSQVPIQQRYNFKRIANMCDLPSYYHTMCDLPSCMITICMTSNAKAIIYMKLNILSILLLWWIVKAIAT